MSEVNIDNLKTTRQIAESHPSIFTVWSLQWHAKQRESNGLADRQIVFKGPGRSLLWDEPKLMAWRLGQ